MKRRDFIELSAVASVAIMIGSLTEFKNPHTVHQKLNEINGDRKLHMYGGCRDFRMMNDFVPGFFEREIIDSWA